MPVAGSSLITGATGFAGGHLLDCIVSLNKFTILPFDREAAGHFHRLQTLLPRLGSMDLKIAAICLAHDATVLTRNVRDFEKIPGLRVANWLD